MNEFYSSGDHFTFPGPQRRKLHNQPACSLPSACFISKLVRLYSQAGQAKAYPTIARNGFVGHALACAAFDKASRAQAGGAQ